MKEKEMGNGIAEWICPTWGDAKGVMEWWSIIEMLYGAFQTSNELGAMETLDDYELLLNIAQQHLHDAQFV
jgi:hypothetical protein